MNASTPSALTLTTQNSSMQFEEETFAQDGQVEDIIAVDFSKLVTHRSCYRYLF